MSRDGIKYIILPTGETSLENAQITGSRIVKMYRISTEAFDIIKGYRADDSYTQVIEAFLLNQINLEEIKRLFYKGSLRNQIFFKSKKAFQQIQWKYRLWSSEIIDIVKPEKLYKQYYPLHETSLTNAVVKIYEIYHLEKLCTHQIMHMY